MHHSWSTHDLRKATSESHYTPLAHRRRSDECYVALLHLGIVFAGPAAYAFFGVQNLADMEAAGSWIPDAVTVGLVLLFATWAYYGLAAADAVPRQPPFVTAGFWAIGIVYTLRGLGVIPETLGLIYGIGEVPLRHAGFSLTALAIGLSHLRGAVLRRRDLGAR